jgi:predicted NBD/HSP70 family sugar kinase
MRDHNARMFLTHIRNHGELAGSELAKALGTSAQTASVILRQLEEQGFLRKGEPKKGKVGKPQVPYALNPDGAFSLGLRLGRRSADLVLMDFVGASRAEASNPYAFPTPDGIEAFLAKAIPDLLSKCNIARTKILGLGVAAPFELWNWMDALGAPKDVAELWRNYDLESALENVTGLPVTIANDVSMACNAERLFGNGRGLDDFAYFFVGSLIGGGVVLGGQLFEGRNGNAGAFGSIPVAAQERGHPSLLRQASLYRLERDIAHKRSTPVNLRVSPNLFAEEADLFASWRSEAARALAIAIVSVSATLDVQDVLLDGTPPDFALQELLEATQEALDTMDLQGLHPITLIKGDLGRRAGALGAAYGPLMHAHFSEGRPAF